jgi:hypothetical protein
MHCVEVVLKPSQRPINSIVLADIFLDLEPMWYGLIIEPLAKALRAEEEGHLRLGYFI